MNSIIRQVVFFLSLNCLYIVRAQDISNRLEQELKMALQNPESYQLDFKTNSNNDQISIKQSSTLRIFNTPDPDELWNKTEISAEEDLEKKAKYQLQKSSKKKTRKRN